MTGLWMRAITDHGIEVSLAFDRPLNFESNVEARKAFDIVMTRLRDIASPAEVEEVA